MNTILIKLVSTNAGWLARQAVKYSAVIAAVVAGWLIGHGFDATHAGVIAAGLSSAALGVVEMSLSWIARKYAVPGLENVNAAIEAMKRTAPIVCVMLLSSCSSLTALVASPLGQFSLDAAEELGKQLATAAEEKVLADIISKASLKIAALIAKGVQDDTAKEIARQAEIAGLKAVLVAAKQQYLGATGHAFTMPKNPIQQIAP